MATTTTRKIGDKVSISDPRYPGVWTIQKRGPVNSTLTPDAGVFRPMRCPNYLLIDPVASAAGDATVTAVPVPPPVTYYVLGQFVRVEQGKYPGLYVVIADKGGDRVNLAKAGGDDDRYVRMPRTLLTAVDAKDVLK